MTMPFERHYVMTEPLERLHSLAQGAAASEEQRLTATYSSAPAAKAQVLNRAHRRDHATARATAPRRIIWRQVVL